MLSTHTSSQKARKPAATGAIPEALLDALSSMVEASSGIQTSPSKRYLLRDRLGAALKRRGILDSRSLKSALAGVKGEALRRELIDAMTTNETLWFRDPAMWAVFKTKLFGQFEERLRESPRQPVTIWSAACATGQEPYSLAMLLAEHARKNPRSALQSSAIRIEATDISSTALYVAQSARYGPEAMCRGFEGDYADFRQRYFSEDDDRVATLSARIKSAVRFRRGNLLEDQPAPARFDLILLRNVLLYFSPEVRSAILEKIAVALRPGGVLVLGAAESPLRYSPRFRLERHGRVNLWRLKAAE